MSEELLARWRDANWQIIAEHDAPPVTHVALDEAILTSVQRKERGPTLRFWGWSAPGVIIGRFQSYRNEIDDAGAAELGVNVVRRMSGGGAMLVQPNMTITYSMYMPVALLEGISIRDSYRFCDNWVVEIFRELGADVNYIPVNDISSPQGKVGGAAQSRRPGVVLHHTTIAYQMSARDATSLAHRPREALGQGHAERGEACASIGRASRDAARGHRGQVGSGIPTSLRR